MKKILLIVLLLMVLSGGCRNRVVVEDQSLGALMAQQYPEPIKIATGEIISGKMMSKKPLKKMAIDPISASIKKISTIEKPVEAVNVLESQVSPGNLSYDIPLDMVYGKDSRVTLRVDNKVSDALTAGMSEYRQLEQVDISTTMRAVLTGDGFEIDTMLSSSIQIRKFDRPTEWKWDVKPVKFGMQKLRLKLTCILKRQGYTDENYDLDVFEVERKIDVDHWILFKDIIYKYWKEIMGAIFGSGIFGWFITRIRKKFKEEFDE